MNTTSKHDERIAKMTFASVYPLYVAKIEKKGRTIEELHQVIEWLCGYSKKEVQRLIDEKLIPIEQANVAYFHFPDILRDRLFSLLLCYIIGIYQ